MDSEPQVSFGVSPSSGAKKADIVVGFLIGSWVTAIFSAFLPFAIILLLANAIAVIWIGKRFNSVLLSVIPLLMTPYLLLPIRFFIKGIMDYQRGEPSLIHYGHSSLGIDPEYRIGWSDTDAEWEVWERIEQIPNNLAVKMMFGLFGYAPGSYTGTLPTREEIERQLRDSARTIILVGYKGDSVIYRNDSMYINRFYREFGFEQDEGVEKMRYVGCTMNSELALIGLVFRDELYRSVAVDLVTGKTIMGFYNPNLMGLQLRVYDDETNISLANKPVYFYRDSILVDSTRTSMNMELTANMKMLLQPGKYTVIVDVPGYEQHKYNTYDLQHNGLQGTNGMKPIRPGRRDD